MIRATFKTRPTRALCFDLENRPLAYWYDGQTTSEITAFGWKWSDTDWVSSMLLTNNGEFIWFEGKHRPQFFGANEAYEFFTDQLGRADVVYGHNIRRHDLPMLNAGLLRRGLDPLPELRTTDTCRDLPKRGGMSVSLENLAAYLGLEGEKKSMNQPAWEDANRLTDGGIAAARERVVSDVLLQEKLRDELTRRDLLKPPRMWRP
jgi:hypothetical protein